MSGPSLFIFAPFRLDVTNAQLWCAGGVRPLTAKAFAVLCYLVEHAGELVSKDDLIEAVWQTPHVSDMALASCIRDARRALDDSGQTPEFIQTVRGLGYRFIAPVTVETSDPATDTSRRQALVFNRVQINMVARKIEVARLHQAFTGALRGERQVVLITGEVGIGKTTLVDTFVTHVASESETAWIGHGQCIEHYGAGEAYLPLFEILGQLGRYDANGRLAEVLFQYAPSWLLQIPALIPDAELETLQRRASSATRERMLRELTEAVEVLTAEWPLVLVLEDLHWSDRSTIDWLAYTARRRNAARLMVVGTFRSVEAMVYAHPIRTVTQELQLHGQATELVLDYLSEQEVSTYLQRRFEGRILPEQLPQVLHQRTSGNPLFLKAVLDDIERNGLLSDESWKRDGASLVDAVVGWIPENLRRLIERQVDQLVPEEQVLIEAASVAGDTFAVAAVAAGLEQTIETVEELCARLVQRNQFLNLRGTAAWRDGTVSARYGFMHDLYRETIYGRLPMGRRSRWHQTIGRRLESGYGAKAEEIAAELAMHFMRGQDAPRALHYLRLAGDNALQRHAYQEAISHFDSALALIPQRPPTDELNQYELALQIDRCSALIVTKGYAAPEIETAYARAWELCQRVGEPIQFVPIWMGLRRYYGMRGELLKARKIADEFFAFAQREQESMYLLEAHYELGNNAYWQGELMAAHTHLKQSLTLYDAQSYRHNALLQGVDSGVMGGAFMAVTLWLLGHPDQALKQGQRALDLAQDLAVPYTLANALCWMVILYQCRGEVTAAQDSIEAVLSLAHEYQFDLLLGVGMSLQGWILVQQGQWEAGIAQLRQGIAAEEETGCVVNLPYTLSLLAEAYWVSGQIGASLSTIADGLQWVDRFGGHACAAELYRLRGECLQAQPGVGAEAAVDWFGRALDVARCQRAIALELRAAISFAQWWQQQGKREEARALLTPVYQRFTEGFETADLIEAKLLLGELDP